MAETPLPGNPLGLVADPRYRRIRLGFDYRRPGQAAGYREVTLEVLEGEGEVFYEPNYLPTLGTLEEGALVIASPCFPRFAPLTLSLRGADIRFTTRHRQVISCALVDEDEEMVRIGCTNFWRAARRLRLRRRTSPLDDQGDSSMEHLTLRTDGIGDPAASVLETQVTRGSVTGLHCDRVRALDGTSIHDRITLRRGGDGELRWRLQCARMELRFRDGLLSDLQLSTGGGPLAMVGFLDQASSGVSIDASFLDSLS